MWTKLFVQFVYWFALPTRGLAIGAFAWRKLIGMFPVFFFYLLASELSDIARLITYWTPRGFSSHAYQMTYWLTDSVVSAFALLATWELCGRRLFSGFQRVSFYRRIFPVAAVPILGAGLLASFVIVTGYKSGGQTVAWLVRFVHGFDGLRIAVLFFFVALMVLMGRQWRTYEFGVAVGLGIDAGGFLVTSSAVLKFEVIRSFAAVLPSLANDLACIIWLITFVRAGRGLVPIEAGEIDPGLVYEAKKTEDALKSLLKK